MISLQAGRAPVADFNRWAESQIATYKNKIEKNVPIAKKNSWMAHPVQKEAIQNSADALDSMSEDKWCVIFEIDEQIPPRYISITDKGTHGLTGKAIVSKEDLDKLQKETPNEYQRERWAKFEALSYPNIDPTGRGSRGQGKWVFIAASNDKTIFYDTLRKDGVYRIGAWLGNDQLLKKPPEGEEARSMFKKNLPDLESLYSIGTRVIIVNPKKEVWEGFFHFLESPLKAYIAETWWEPLKAGSDILIKWRKKTLKVKPPIYYVDSFIKEESLDVWTVGNADLRWDKNPDAKVKELTIIYSKDAIPEEFRGIAIQRGGMKICNFDVRNGNPSIKAEVSERIYGWIKFNEEAEKELRNIEDPTHYDFSAYLGTFGFQVFGKNGWLEQEIRRFAEQRLGVGSEAKKFDRLDIIVANKLNRFTNKYKLGVPLERPVAPPGNGKDHERKELRIRMPKPRFPSGETRRVEFGEKISEIKVSVVNDSKISRKLKISLLLKTASREVGERTLKSFVIGETIVVSAQSESAMFGPYEILFDKKQFDSGTYVIEAEIVALEGDIFDRKFGKSIVIDQERELIYLDVDPPVGKGLFEFIDRVKFEEEKDLQYRVKAKEDKMRIQINVLHPAYRHSEELDDLLAEKKLYLYHHVARPLVDYEINIGAEVIAQFDIRKDAKLVKDNRKKFLVQRAEDKKSFFIEAVDQASRIAQRIRFEVL
ncbi:MAG: hypothetical protein ACFFCW_28060 [Candidatus Hodarchaeota archaeon]